MQAARIVIKGQVQGLGFRPFVLRLARRLSLRGTVSNNKTGVDILVEGRQVAKFVRSLKQAPPKLARISSIKVTPAKPAGLRQFAIIQSDTGDRHPEPGTQHPVAVDILPDLATCPDCLADVSDQDNRRYRYPFTNCTQCGPRYSIIQSLPYDRPRTTMKAFVMCPDCRTEYEAQDNRRFHAQPNCCPVCGPRLRLLHAAGQIFDETTPLDTAIRLLLDGKLLAIKSLGGFHIACDALNEPLVVELRKRKARPDKPLAVMCSSVETTKTFCKVDPGSKLLLEDVARPIVLMPKLTKPGALTVAPSVAPGINNLGVMLPYAPLHHLLFRKLDQGQELKVLVMTSANLKDEPVISEDAELVAKLGTVVDYILTNDRPIANRCDDSVLFASPLPSFRSHPSAPILVRRSRGYVPSPVILDSKRFSLKPVLASGAEQKNTFALGAGDKVYVGPHIGDLNSASALEFFEQSLDSYRRWYDIRPELFACDLHPDMLATRFAENIALKSHKPLVRVQHHHAHIASVIAEHNLPEPVLGIALDGTGLGTDGKIWGGELLKATRAGFERVGHLRYLPLIGGEASILEPLRIAAGYLLYLFGETAVSKLMPSVEYGNLNTQLHMGANVVFTSSTGRLFDAVAGMTRLCPHASFDGQAPAMLESAADPKEKKSYFSAEDLRTDSEGQLLIDPARWLKAILDDLAQGVTPGRISRRFHHTFVQALTRAAINMARAHKTKAVCLSGGSFQNRLLLAELYAALTKARLKVFTNHAVPVNDGGVSFGQAIVADAQSRTKRKP